VEIAEAVPSGSDDIRLTGLVDEAIVGEPTASVISRMNS
jgi:hypothetical protein